MRKIILTLAILTFSLISLSCVTKAPLYPLKVENVWVFEDDKGNLLTYKIVGAKDNADKGVKLYHLGTFTEGTMGKVDYYFQNEEGLFYYDTLKSEEPITALKYPLEEGTEWTYGEGDTAINFKVLGKEEVSVPAGDFKDCFKIEFKPVSGTLIMNEWFCPQVGFVKYEITREIEVTPEDEEKEGDEKVVSSEEDAEEKEPVYETVTTILNLKSFTLN